MAAIYGFDDVGNHANMLLDVARVKAFAQAIAQTVGPDDVVADIGSGTGLLGILAAKAGARRVYCVERGPMADLIDSAAADNGVAERITTLRVDARDVVFAEPPTVIVSETLGSFGIDEDILGLLKTVAQRAAPGYRMIPRAFSIQLALAHLPTLQEEMTLIEAGLPVLLPALTQRLRSRVALAHVERPQVVSTIVGTGDLRVGQSNIPSCLDAQVEVLANTSANAGISSANAIVAWFFAELCPGVKLLSGPDAPSPSWANLVFPLWPPLQIAPGQQVSLQVRPRLVTERGTWAWSAACNDVVRHGDAMKSLLGKRDDLFSQLGLRKNDAERADALTEDALAVWGAALTGGPDTLNAMTQRVLEAFPTRFGDVADARQAVLRLLRAAQVSH